MTRLRTAKAEQRYKKLIDSGLLQGNCRLCDAPSLKEFAHWRIIRNEFPYDRIAKIHDMIVPKRHVKEGGLTPQEQREYATIKTGYIDKTYEYIVEPTPSLKSIPEHFHLHLIVVKD